MKATRRTRYPLQSENNMKDIDLTYRLEARSASQKKQYHSSVKVKSTQLVLNSEVRSRWVPAIDCCLLTRMSCEILNSGRQAAA